MKEGCRNVNWEDRDIEEERLQFEFVDIERC